MFIHDTLDAIEKNDSKNVEILLQDDTDNVVLFLSEDYTGQPMLSLNTFVEIQGINMTQVLESTSKV